MDAADLLDSDFAAITDLVRVHAREQGRRPALFDPHRTVTWRELDDLIERIAARLQADGIGRGDTVAIAGHNSVRYVLALR